MSYKAVLLKNNNHKHMNYQLWCHQPGQELYLNVESCERAKAASFRLSFSEIQR